MLARRLLRPSVLRSLSLQRPSRFLSVTSQRPNELPASQLFRLPLTIAQFLSPWYTLNHHDPDAKVTVTGWIKSIRKQKNIAFAVVTDGSESRGIQAVLVRKKGQDAAYEDALKRCILTNGAAIRLVGKLVESPGSGQSYELLVKDVQEGASVTVLGECDPIAYPIQKKDLSPEYLRDNVHLRARTDTIAGILRLRHRLQREIDDWFDNRGFIHVNTPILTSNDAEGAGETFRIAPLSPLTRSPHSIPTTPYPPSEFFNTPAHLTVSHQLHLEALTSSLSRVYTLSPCFRAERSDTSRHLAEFWMLEAEWVTEAGVYDVCDAVESLIKTVMTSYMTSDPPGLLFLVPEAGSAQGPDTYNKPWPRISYTEAIKILKAASPAVAFEYVTEWGKPLQSEHERYLAERYVGGPVFITDYPTSLKPFYMRENPLDSEGRSTVACFDLLVPGVGELVGGSVREDRLEILQRKLVEAGLSSEDGEGPYKWYEDLRKYGGAPHAGFGMGFERLVSWVSGVENVRECIPFPRWAGKLRL
ncbi:asparaginyl-tRNA synthetase [Coprinopsis sp. MPI-PUGE-AT-0042]|nr:asparaginyl-tRNA synthetase [Coprinopsis sp. MPI-PUGE-AT-0042]